MRIGNTLVGRSVTTTGTLVERFVTTTGTLVSERVPLTGGRVCKIGAHDQPPMPWHAVKTSGCLSVGDGHEGENEQNHGLGGGHEVGKLRKRR